MGWGPKCCYTLHGWAHNIVVTVAAAIADEDNHDDDNKDLEVTGVKLGKTYHDVYKAQVKCK